MLSLVFFKGLSWLSYPFADRIVIPDGLRDRRSAKYVTHDSYHELAYLHPDRFTPDRGVLAELGVELGEPFYILRLVAFKAYHDVHQAGLSYAARKRLVDLFSRWGKVFITVEGDLPDEFTPYQMPIPPQKNAC